MKPTYVIYVCPKCGEQNQFAGFCDSCNTRLVQVPCVPTEHIVAFAGTEFLEQLRAWQSLSPSG